ncbi:MAG: Slp family lipoprotein [Gammaproteobacteria bacterium]
MIKIAHGLNLRYAGLALGALLSACATTPPVVLQGTFSSLTPQQSLTQPATGQTVRWGGEIIQTLPGKDETCFELIARPLDSTARPILGDNAQQGRFIVCNKGFYDPEVYVKGRELTVIGRLQPPSQGKIGEYEYRYPRVQSDSLHLWPPRVAYDYSPYYRDPFYDPFYDPFWPYGFPRHWR